MLLVFCLRRVLFGCLWVYWLVLRWLSWYFSGVVVGIISGGGFLSSVGVGLLVVLCVSVIWWFGVLVVGASNCFDFWLCSFVVILWVCSCAGWAFACYAD